MTTDSNDFEETLQQTSTVDSSKGHFLSALFNETTEQIINTTLSTISTTTATTTTTFHSLVPSSEEVTTAQQVPSHEEEKIEDFFGSSHNMSTEPSSFDNLIESLKTKLKDIPGIDESEEEQLLNDVVYNHVPHATNHSSLAGRYPHDDVILHSDTIILMASLGVMILLGLVLRKVFLCLSEREKKAKLKYENGVKQLGANVRDLTKTISFELGETNNNNNNNNRKSSNSSKRASVTSIKNSPSKSLGDEEITLEILKPSTHVLTREDSEVGEFMTQLEARRLSKMHNFLVNHER